MAFDFPDTPTVGARYSPAGGPTYDWDGSVWKMAGVSSYVLKSGDTMTGPLVNNVGIQAGTTAKQSTALISAIALGNNIEFGHTNPLGYRSNLGCDATGGIPWLIFNGEAGTTGATYRTRGKQASIFKSDLAGGFEWGNVASANADNQALVSQMTLSNSGTLNLSGGIISAGVITCNGSSVGITGPGSVALSLNKGLSGNYAYVQAQKGGVNRWIISLGNTNAESGANAGSNLDIYRYSDTGTYLGAALTIARDDGATVINGGLTVGGSLQVNGGTINGSASVLYLGPSGSAGANVLIYPSGTASNTGRITITPTLMTMGNIAYTTGELGTFSSAAPWTTGVMHYSTAVVYHSVNSATSYQWYRFYNINGVVGYIQSANSATVYGTTSDEKLKEFNAEYDPAEAIRIIRADPVLGFTWKATGEEAVGWFAQKSYAVDENLAIQPGPTANKDGTFTEVRMEAKPGDEDFVPWGIDYGRRTPYLWAALSNVLDRLEALEAKLSITDPKPTRKKAA